jgi:hypothetical protein
MRAAEMELRVEGVVRVMHPDQGMGVEFTQATPEQRAALEKFLGVLTENRALSPELLVEPEGLEPDSALASNREGTATETDDPLIGLFRNQSELPASAFLAQLHKQRGVAAAAAAASA